MAHIITAPATAPTPAETVPAEKLKLLADTLMPGASPAEVELFAHVCNRVRLDPFTRQIHAVKRRQKGADDKWAERWVFQVGIDGCRLVAQRSHEYEGQTEIEYCTAAGKWTTVWLDTRPPVAARAGVWRRGFREPLFTTVLWKEYAQFKTDGSLVKMWLERGVMMLGKCAEAASLRRGFPAELSGLYLEEELLRSEVGEPEAQAPRPAKPERVVSRPKMLASSDVVVPIGRYANKPLGEIPLEKLTVWRDEWMSSGEAKATAERRLGENVVMAVYAEIERRIESPGSEPAPVIVPDGLPCAGRPVETLDDGELSALWDARHENLEEGAASDDPVLRAITWALNARKVGA